MKVVRPISLAAIALAAGALFSAGSALAQEHAGGPTNEEDPAAMALTREIARMESPPFNPVAARELARNNGCFRCHSIQKEGKPGPSWSSVAARFRPLPEIVQPVVQERVIYHLVSGEKAEFPDGHAEYHRLIHTNPPNDPAQIKNLINFILSL
ncbi:MAG: hypothetical protein FWG56_08800 [Desulfovibrionaceae bacterium]|nr:hypothetical protein [Desulfovibrionaceae bacterium]